MSTLYSKLFNFSHKKGKNFIKSMPEDDTYILLQKMYPDTIRGYKDTKRYPYSTDFYIPSNDIFIESQYHWTHGKHPYNPKDEKDLAKANKWKTKGGSYYLNSYDTWVNRDVRKREAAKKAGLKYIELWQVPKTEEELKNILNIKEK